MARKAGQWVEEEVAQRMRKKRDTSRRGREDIELLCWLSLFLDPGGRSKTAAVGLYFIFPGICNLSLREDVILEWLFLPCKPNKKLKTYIEKISDFIHKGHLGWKMWFIYTMEYYAAEKNNDIMKFAGKWMELENVILSEVSALSSHHQTGFLQQQMRIDAETYIKTLHSESKLKVSIKSFLSELTESHGIGGRKSIIQPRSTGNIDSYGRVDKHQMSLQTWASNLPANLADVSTVWANGNLMDFFSFISSQEQMLMQQKFGCMPNEKQKGR
ncbi:hypothetical protein STEG23_006951 [Scotinomys teguina]